MTKLRLACAVLCCPFTMLAHAVRARPTWSLIICAGVAIAGGWLSLGVWIGWQLESAERACRLHNYEEGRVHVDRVLALRRNHYRANILAARIHRGLQEYARAEAHLLLCKPHADHEFHTEWLLLRAQRAEFPQREMPLRTRLRDASYREPLVLETMVYCLYRESRFPTAEYYIERWLEQAPDDAVGHCWRGAVHSRTGKTSDARHDFERALALEPEFWNARFQLAGVLLQRLDLVELPEHLRALESSGWRPTDVSLLAGMYHLARNELEAADQRFADVLRVKADYPAALFQRGRVALRRQQFQQAEDWLRRAIQLDPQNGNARYALYQCLLQQLGREKSAADELAAYKQFTEHSKRLAAALRRVEQGPNDADLLTEVGEFYLQQQQSFLAHQYLTRALRLQPGHDRAERALEEVSKIIKSAGP